MSKIADDLEMTMLRGKVDNILTRPEDEVRLLLSAINCLREQHDALCTVIRLIDGTDTAGIAMDVPTAKVSLIHYLREVVGQSKNGDRRWIGETLYVYHNGAWIVDKTPDPTWE